MQQETNGKAVASLVLGILAMVFVFFGWGAIFGILLGIIGLVLGINAKKGTTVGSGMATAGIVLSIIAIAICAIAFIACVACIGAIGSMGY